MNKITRFAALLLALVLCAAPTLSAFAEAEPTAAPEATENVEAGAEATAEPEKNPTDVIATVNGEPILRETFDNIIANLTNRFSQYGYDVSDAAFASQVQQIALTYAVQLSLMEQKAKELGFDQFTDEELAQMKADNAENWNEIVEQYVTYYGGLSEDATDEEKAEARVKILSMLESAGYTEATMLEDAIYSASLDRVQAEMIKGATVTDEEVQASYDEHVKADEASYKEDVSSYEYMTQYYGEQAYYVPEGYRGVTHILLTVDEALLDAYQTLNAKLEEQEDEEENASATAAPEAETTADPEATVDPEATEAPTEEPVTREQVDAAYQAIIDSVQPTIDEINQKLADGVPFADLVAEYGTDPGMTQEPNKTDGYSVHMDSIIWDPAFVRAAFSVDHVGDIAEPVVGRYGVHIVQYTRDVPAGPVALTDELKESLRETLLQEKEDELYSKTLEAWEAAAVVTYSEEVADLVPAEEAEAEKAE